MTWSKAILKQLEKDGKIKNVHFPAEPKNKIEIPKEIGPYKLHIASVLEGSGLKYVTELVFDSERKFRFDWAIEELNVAIEYEGIFSEKSGHTTLTGYSKDVVKYNLATKLGWKVLRYTANNYLDIESDLNGIKKFKR